MYLRKITLFWFGFCYLLVEYFRMVYVCVCVWIIVHFIPLFHCSPPLHTESPREVLVDASVQELGGFLVINLSVTDTSEAPATALNILVQGLGINTTIPFSQPILPGEVMVFPDAASVPLGGVNRTVYTLIVNAQNLLGSVTVLSSTFSYPLPTSSRSL